MLELGLRVGFGSTVSGGFGARSDMPFLDAAPVSKPLVRSCCVL